MIAQTSDSRGVPVRYISKKDGLRRTKFVIDIDSYEAEPVPGKKEKRLLITLRVPLDRKYPAEEAIYKAAFDLVPYDSTGNGILTVCYSVKMELKAERDLLVHELKQNYKKKRIGTLLKSGRLRRLTKDQRNEILAPMAAQGVSVFSRLFPFDNLPLENPHPKDAPIIGAALRSVLSRPQLISVQSKEPLFPWAFLYDDIARFDKDNYSTLRPGRFWGFKHELQQEVGCTSPRLWLPLSFKILAAIDPLVDKKRHSGSDHPLVRLKSNVTPALSKDELGNALKDFKDDIFYFFGHADDFEPPIESKSWLELQKAHLNVYELRVNYKAPNFSKDPVLVIINGCRTAPLETWDDQTILGYLCINSKMSLCCLATTAAIPGSFAAEFARYLLNEFLLNKRPLGSAILCARKMMFKEWRNPLGLLYSLFGSLDTRIKDDEGDDNHGESNLESAGGDDQ